jgi:hypothetical protein
MFFEKMKAGWRACVCAGDGSPRLHCWICWGSQLEAPTLVVHPLNTMTSRRSLRSKSDSTTAAVTDLGTATTTTRRAAFSDRMNRTSTLADDDGSLKAPPAPPNDTESTAPPNRSTLEGDAAGQAAAAALVVVVGARCAVHFELQRDYFGPHQRLDAWFPATVEHVTGSTNRRTIQARTTDNAVCENVPQRDFRLLRRDGALDYWSPRVDDNNNNNNNSTEEVVFADSAPDVLYPGDVVCALFQQGLVEANPDAWYRGRVLATHTVNDKNAVWKLADIGYDDDDFERNVPYSGPHGISSSIMLLERGVDNPSWLEGLIVPLTSQTWKTCQSGVVVVQTMEPSTTTTQRAQQNGSMALLVSVQYTLNGKKVSEQRPYKEVVQSLVDVELQRMKAAPVVGYVDVHSASSKPLPFPQQCLRKAAVPEAAACRQQQPSRVTTRRRPQAKATLYYGSDDEESEDDDDMDDDLGLAIFVEKKTLRGRAPNAQKASAKARKAASAKTCDDDDDDHGDNVASAAALVRTSGRVKRERAPLSSSSASIQPPPRKVSRPLSGPTKKPLPLSDDVVAVAESVRSLTLPDPIPPPSLPLRPLDHSSAHHLGQSLNSSDSVSAADLLIYMGSMHGTSLAVRLSSLFELSYAADNDISRFFPQL